MSEWPEPDPCGCVNGMTWAPSDHPAPLIPCPHIDPDYADIGLLRAGASLEDHEAKCAPVDPELKAAWALGYRAGVKASREALRMIGGGADDAL